MNGNKIYNSGSIYPFILTFFSFTSSSFFFEKILRIIYIHFSFIERAISRSVSKYYLEVSINYKQVSSKHFKQIIGETKGTEMNGNKIYNSGSIYPFIILSFFSFTLHSFFFEKILRVIYIIFLLSSEPFHFLNQQFQNTISKYKYRLITRRCHRNILSR